MQLYTCITLYWLMLGLDHDLLGIMIEICHPLQSIIWTPKNGTKYALIRITSEYNKSTIETFEITAAAYSYWFGYHDIIFVL